MAVYETWFGINQDQHFNSLHVHPASTVSGVLYIHLGTDSSSLWVVDPRLGAWHPEANPVDLQPSTGDLILFPSWLPHMVPPSQVCERVVPSVGLYYSAQNPFTGSRFQSYTGF